MNVRTCIDLFRRRWPLRVTGLLVTAVLAVVLGSGLAHLVGEAPASSYGAPLAAPPGTLDRVVWTTPLDSLSAFRLSTSRPSDGHQRPGQLAALIQPRADSMIVEAAGVTAAIAALIVLRLLAGRDHGVRAPPLGPVLVFGRDPVTE